MSLLDILLSSFFYEFDQFSFLSFLFQTEQTHKHTFCFLGTTDWFPSCILFLSKLSHYLSTFLLQDKIDNSASRSFFSKKCIVMCACEFWQDMILRSKDNEYFASRNFAHVTIYVFMLCSRPNYKGTCIRVLQKNRINCLCVVVYKLFYQRYQIT